MTVEYEVPVSVRWGCHHDLQARRRDPVTLAFVAGGQDTTGWRCRFVVTTDFGDGSHEIERVVAGVAGRVAVPLSAADLDLTPGRYTYRLVRLDPAPAAILAWGSFKVQEAADADAA